MAISNNQGTKTQQVIAKVYATDEAGMMQDAKDYAKRDFQIVLATMRMFPVNESITNEEIADALIQIKYKQIVDARITNRVSYFD
jgi:hypothetical protein